LQRTTSNQMQRKEGSDRVEVLRFLKEHVMGRTVATPKTVFKVDGNKLEGEYEDLTTFNNLGETEHGFSFDVTTVSKDTRYDLDKDGKRILPGRDLSGTEVFRYEFGERISTKKLTGTGRMISRTTKGASFEGTAILVTGVKVADGKLSWNAHQPSTRCRRSFPRRSNRSDKPCMRPNNPTEVAGCAQTLCFTGKLATSITQQ
jgi:hypothetical protein